MYKPEKIILTVVQLIVVLTLLLSNGVLASNFNNRVNVFTIEDGLSQTGVTCLLIDRKGFLWTGTQDGLNRFDGYTFKTYRWQPSDNNSLCDNFIRALCQDRKGNIWIATNNGLSVFNYQTGLFTNYLHSANDVNSISSNSLYNVYEDKEGTIWVKTIESLEKYNPQNNTFSHYFHYNNVFNYATSDISFPIFEDNRGQFWIGSKDGLFLFDRQIELFERFFYRPNDINSLSDNRIKSIAEDNSGNIWIGTEYGLNQYDFRSQIFKRIDISAHSQSPSDISINKLFFEENQKQLWIGTRNGVTLLNISNNSVQKLSAINNKVEQLLGDISSIIKDKSGILWLGTSQGLIKFDSKPYKFNLFIQKIAKNQSSNNVTAIYKDQAQNHWIGTNGSGLIVKNEKTGEETYYYGLSRNENLPGDKIFEIYSDKEQNIWIGSNKGLHIYSGEKFSSFCSFANTNCSSLKNIRIFTIYEDMQNTIWIGSNQGLHKFNKKTKQFDPFVKLTIDQNKTIQQTVYSIAQDKSNNLWVGTDKGLYKIFLQTEKKVLYNTEINKVGRICSNYIYSLLCDLNGQVWIGTSNGLCLYNKTTDDFSVYTDKQGLVNNTIFSMLLDKAGNLWLGTKRGITKMNIENEEFTGFDISDGLQGYEFNIGSAFIAKDGELFFGGISGYNSFYPDKMQRNQFKPEVVITSLEIFESGKFSNISIGSTDKITLPYSTDMFNIEFASLDYTIPHKNLFKYQLSTRNEVGVWININNKHSASFSKLSPGEYVFKVIGTNSDQIWSDKEAYLKIVILTPFWRSQSALIIYGLVIFFLIYSLVQLRTVQLRKTNKHLMERELIAQAIALQKEELTLKNKNITDSINYAKRIQEALLPSERAFRKILPNSFVLHKPRDIVSGDFYWIYENNQKVVVAAVDCTGHGVPGAFMSIIGFEIFRKIVNTQTNSPGEFLDKIMEDFQKIFKDVEHISLKDGMDVTLCFIDKQTNILEFAGAFNPIYIVHDNKLNEIKGNRFSVSLEKSEGQQNFKTHQIQLDPNDMVYMFSDGFADQFGGYEGKKYKYRRFRHLLLNIHDMPLDEQKKTLDDSIETWRGNHEQVDDILIVGIKAQYIS